VPRIACIVPPYLLRRAEANGDLVVRVRAHRTLAIDAALREARDNNRGRLTAIPPGPAAEPRGVLRRSIADCRNTENLETAAVVRAEGDPATGDPAANEAYDGLGATWKLFWEQFERDSIDDRGLILNGFVHYGRDYDNAFWDGIQMVFGDGDGELFARFTIAVDVIGHELAHGVTEAEARLDYEDQPGALNESISDVFGSLVKQYALGQTAEEADWLIGSGLLLDHPDMALRSMLRPGTAYDHPVLGKDPQPDSMSGYVETTQDDGGVHINSGIPNRAFALTATAIGGEAWLAPGRIWYEALRDDSLTPTAGFADFARVTLATAARLYGEGGTEHDAVTAAWETVEVQPG
jgi:Zn-dependent metalloprotease